MFHLLKCSVGSDEMWYCGPALTHWKKFFKFSLHCYNIKPTLHAAQMFVLSLKNGPLFRIVTQICSMKCRSYNISDKYCLHFMYQFFQTIILLNWTILCFSMHCSNCVLLSTVTCLHLFPFLIFVHRIWLCTHCWRKIG